MQASMENKKKFEKLRMQEMAILKEYDDYYLCGKIKDGKVLYRECFMKSEVDDRVNEIQPRYQYK